MAPTSTRTTLLCSCYLFLVVTAQGNAWKALNGINGVDDDDDDDGSSTSMETGELLGLFEFMNALLEDTSWSQFHPHPCTDTPWPGIQCELVSVQGQGHQDPYLHVTKLHIGSDVAGSPPCKSSAKLSSSLLKLTHLKSLSLFGCFLTTTVSLPPYLFTNASKLEQLVIKSNPGLVGEISSSIATMHGLRVLSLSQNSLHGVIPSELGELAMLEQLDLSYNQLTGRIPDEIGGLTSLTIFDLSWNELQGEIPWSVGQLHSLQKIDLSSNNLTGKLPANIGQLHSLVLLDLSHNSLTGPLPSSLSNLTDLEDFLMANNPLNTGIPQFLGALKKLVVLGLSNCFLSGPLPSFFGSLSNLTTLSLDKNRLSGAIPESLGSLPHLGLLNLSQNQLGGELAFSEEFVSRLGKRLDVRDNSGLCTDPLKFQNLSLYFEAPPCLDASKSSSNNTWTDDQRGVDQSNAVNLLPYKGDRNCSLSYLCLCLVGVTFLSSGLDLDVLLVFVVLLLYYVQEI